MNKDLVQIDADTAMLLYSKGLTHLPVLSVTVTLRTGLLHSRFTLMISSRT